MDESTFRERRSDRIRRREASRVAQQRRDAVIDALILAAPLVLAWALCWAFSHVMLAHIP